VLESLIASRHAGTYGGALGGGASSALIHAALIAGAVWATLNAGGTRGSRREVPIVGWFPGTRTTRPQLPARSSALPAGPAIGLRLTMPTTVPIVIPPPSAMPFDPGRFYRTGPTATVPGAAGADTVVLRRGSPFAAEMVEERPERIGGPAPRYPELLRQAGIDGRVVVECVVDTAGRAEPGSVRVVAATNPLFEGPAREAVAASVFRPGRLAGRAVRVRVQVPVVFSVSRGGGR
jgi:protein TonB